jgi:hypothetical protein
VPSTEDEMQKAVYSVNNIATKYNLKISVIKTGSGYERIKMMLSNHTIEKVNSLMGSKNRRTRNETLFEHHPRIYIAQRLTISMNYVISMNFYNSRCVVHSPL